MESVTDAEVVQHWLGAVVAFFLGWFEWRARQRNFANPRLRLVFPVLCMLDGLVLLTHSHSTYALKNEFMIQSTHIAMGFFALMLGCGRWLEVRLSGTGRAAASLAASSSMLLVGLILLFYADPAGMAW